jgi:hypothetical protein
MAVGMGVPWQEAASLIAHFKGVNRRVEFLGESNAVQVFDDYAHHPTEVIASLSAAKTLLGDGGRLFVAFEPQLHSRVSRLAHEFAKALSPAFFTFLMPTYGAGERDLLQSDKQLSSELETCRIPFVQLSNPEQVAAVALKKIRSKDIVICIGSTEVRRVGTLILEGLGMQSSEPIHLSSITTSTPLITPSGVTVVTSFLANAIKTPDASAVAYKDEDLSYGVLAWRAQMIAEQLLSRGVRTEDVIAVRLRRGTNRVAVFLGILMSGTTYLPIAPDIPESRMRYILRNAQVRYFYDDFGNTSHNDEADRISLPSWTVPKKM